MLRREANITPKLILRLTPYCTRERVSCSQSELEASGYPHHTRYLYPRCSFDNLIREWSKREQVMNIQQLRLPAANVKVIGRPLWQVSLSGTGQRERKKLKAMLWEGALKKKIVM